MAAVSSSSSNNNNKHHQNRNSTTIIDVPSSTSNQNNTSLDSYGDDTDISKNFLIATLTRKGGKGIAAAVNYLRIFDNGVQKFVNALKRNSLLRLAVVFYISLVHFWVLILIWNTPLPTNGTAIGDVPK